MLLLSVMKVLFLLPFLMLLLLAVVSKGLLRTMLSVMMVLSLLPFLMLLHVVLVVEGV